MIKVDVDFKRFEKSVKSYVKDLTQAVEDGVAEVADNVFTEYQQNLSAHEDTGASLAFIYQRDDEGAEDNTFTRNIGSDSYVHTFLEFGTGSVGAGSFDGDLPDFVSYTTRSWHYEIRDRNSQHYGRVITDGFTAKQPLTNAIRHVKENATDTILQKVKGI